MKSAIGLKPDFLKYAITGFLSIFTHCQNRLERAADRTVDDLIADHGTALEVSRA